MANGLEAVEPLEGIVAGTSLWADAWWRLRRNRLAMVGLVVLGVVVLASLAGPPIIAHTNAGRDILARVLLGGRISLLVGITSTLVSLIIGTAFGATAGYLGGRVDEAMMRIVDVLYALPYMMIVIVLLAFFGNQSPFGQLILLFVALGAVSWLTMARIVRGQVMSLKSRDFVQAARATGVTPVRIVLRHLVPNALGPVIVYATLTVPSVMLLEAFLSFLGLGVQAPLASWGSLSADGIQNIAIFPWQLLCPGLTMAVTLFSLNFIGDGLRDALDPQARKS
jgi:oligopeptide transport system permease protein